MGLFPVGTFTDFRDQLPVGNFRYYTYIFFFCKKENEHSFDIVKIYM